MTRRPRSPNHKPNRQEGWEDPYALFRRRYEPGKRVNRQGDRKSDSPATRAFAGCRHLMDCARVALVKFHLRPGLVHHILRKRVRNSVKLMDLTLLCNRAYLRLRAKRRHLISMRLTRGELARAEDRNLARPLHDPAGEAEGDGRGR